MYFIDHENIFQTGEKFWKIYKDHPQKGGK